MPVKRLEIDLRCHQLIQVLGTAQLCHLGLQLQLGDLVAQRLQAALELHPLLIGRDDFAREDKVSVKINEEGGGVYQVNGEEMGGWLAWHKDSIYTDKLNHGGLLWGQCLLNNPRPA